MGRKGSWFSSIKKAFSPEKKGKQASKSNKKWVEKEQPLVPQSSNQETSKVSHPHPHPPVEELKLTEEEKEQTIASEVVRPTPAHFAGKLREEDATIKIQTTFRGYLARRALKALRGLVILKSLVDGPTVKRQTANALNSEALAAVQDDDELPSPLMQRRRLGVWLEATAMVTQRAMARLQRPWQQLHEPAAAMNRTTTGTRPPLFSASIAAAMVELFLSSMATGVQRWPPFPISLPVQALPPPHPGNPSHPNKHIFSCTSPATIGKLTIPATSSNFHGFRV
nr:protein IQ-DOMAIN 1-like [Ipomoea batatas]